MARPHARASTSTAHGSGIRRRSSIQPAMSASPSWTDGPSASLRGIGWTRATASASTERVCDRPGVPPAGIGSALLTDRIAAARELDAAYPTGLPRVLGMWIDQRNVAGAGLARHFGYEPARWFFDMERRIDGDLPAIEPLPDGWSCGRSPTRWHGSRGRRTTRHSWTTGVATTTRRRASAAGASRRRTTVPRRVGGRRDRRRRAERDLRGREPGARAQPRVARQRLHATPVAPAWTGPQPHRSLAAPAPWARPDGRCPRGRRRQSVGGAPPVRIGRVRRHRAGDGAFRRPLEDPSR